MLRLNDTLLFGKIGLCLGLSSLDCVVEEEVE